MTDLDGYRKDFDAFLTGANPNLPKGAVADLLVDHVEHLPAAIDAIASGDLQAGFDMLKMAADQSQKIADPLAAAIVKQYPDKFPGKVDAKAVDLRVTLNNLLGAHVYLAGLPVRMALAGSDPGFKAGAATLDRNSVELSKAIGSVYGHRCREEVPRALARTPRDVRRLHPGVRQVRRPGQAEGARRPRAATARTSTLSLRARIPTCRRARSPACSSCT